MPTYLFLRRLRRSPRRLQRPDPGAPAGADRAVCPRGWRRTIPTGRMPPLVCRGPGRDTGSAPTATAATCCRACSTAPARRWVWWRCDRHYPARRAAGRYPLRLLWRVAGADTDALYRRGDVDAAPDPRLRVRGDARPGAGQRRAGVSPDHLAGLRPSGAQRNSAPAP
ncbi:Uncharacterised protein [Klebsiella pneumoniae]|uniref:Uncharacterized protein n=1 Tax=Klebsiella pneumoniae TaxID=573 RepID=A0A2X1RKK3_KLEPN|nr:Uncharacterised protein [Klebsiella pneumoniae]